MFFDFLSTEEREYFMELAYIVANCDKNFHAEEKRLIEFYKRETKLENYQIKGIPLDKILGELNTVSFISKTSILLEIMALVLADLEYDGEEQKIVKQIRDAWGISDSQFKDIIHWLKNRNIILKSDNL
jgi:hypothetical protein